MLNLFNEIEWDISNDVLDAMLRGVRGWQNETILDIEWCAGELKLLLPATRQDKEGKTLGIYYQEVIKRKARRVTFGDILFCIWKFYNYKKVFAEDLTYVSISDTMKTFSNEQLKMYEKTRSSIKSLYFADFVYPQTKFSGLVHQKDNIYYLMLKE